MAFVGIIAVLTFDIILCIIEIPKMLSEKLIKELVTFSVMLMIGTVIAVLKAFEVKVPNPSDFLAWVYSPVADLMKSLLTP